MMDNFSLAALLDEDREMVRANLKADRTLPAAQSALEKAVDRVMYRYTETCDDPALLNSAQHILQTMKNTLPVMDTVGEARIWKKQAASPANGKLNFGPRTLVLLLAGLALVLAAVVGVLIAGRLGGALAFLKALLPALLGGAALVLGGIQSARPRKQADPGEADVRTEYLVDVEKAWHCLRGAMLQADGQLEQIRQENAVQRQRQEAAIPAGPFASDALELFAELLETAYGSTDEEARESASAIRFYLHSGGVDAVDYAAGRESWFEFLPADRERTLRPALVREGKLLKKGLAAGKRQ